MKKILITGANSYIGMSFENWLSNFDGYSVDTIDTMNDVWKKADFSKYDVIFHVAGIAHVDAKSNMKDLYYKVNTDLAVEVAKNAKECGVRQFIFMSSIILYGSANEFINENTIPRPRNFYGDSKLKADEKLHRLEDNKFKVVSMRPPMIYGKGSKGNYPKLSALAQKIPIFPGVKNRRSMLHIDNLCECIRLVIDNEENGFFYPQNREYVNTAKLVKTIAEVHGKTLHIVKIFDPLLGVMSKKINVFNKMFGNLVYDKKISGHFGWKYCVHDFEKSIQLTEGIE